MMNVLDLCCGVGGAREGYKRAGLKVVTGVDHADQPDYPGEFIKADVLTFLRGMIEGRHRVSVDLVHVSPPCQYAAAISKGTNAHLRHQYPDLYGPVKELLEQLGIPHVIENPAARPDVVLCGEMFGLKVIRHRNFELGGWTAPAPEHKPHRGRVAGMRHGVWYEGPYFAVYGNGGGKGTVAQWQDAMDIHWTSVRKSIAEAIPPAYTEYIGRQFIAWQASANAA
jgi:DNA (cytosine-5)-methyltransferase 1